ncbi:DNA primase [Blattabacterium cuenoti]|uniref:DNA primase n=1 Tax=Blattabacterium cuenoti TaxID=1653831 RepID=UPI00163CD146|nr:DNA primase [Blattabacterium cuenoti]
MISDTNKKKILSISCIEDVIGDFVELKKSGLNYRGLSPFSKERNPSLIVSPDKKIWKDFSSGKGGNIITFLMEHENFTYGESLRYLANKYNIKIDDNKEYLFKKKEKHEEILYVIQDYAKNFYINQLYVTKEGKENGLYYLIKKRGYNINIIKEFELGYAPISWNIFTKKALEKGFKLIDLIKSGFTLFRSSNYFDCFRNRVMFPIHNLSGKIVGFGGRNINSSSFNVMKYINSSESVIFQKGKTLYGLFQAKKNILKENICYLVEGYTDVISLHQSGIKNVVASSGISLTINQILLIKKFTKNIVLFYDGDHSGIKASLRVINMVLEQGMNIRILLIPKGEDPDSISKKYSTSELRFFLRKNSYNFVYFKKKIYEKFWKNDPINKFLLVINILNSISKIYSVLKKELFLQEASKILNIREKILLTELERIDRKKDNVNGNFSFIRSVVGVGKNINNKIKHNLSFLDKNNHEHFIENKLMQLILYHGNKKIIKNGNGSSTTYTTITEKFSYFFKYGKIHFTSKENEKNFLIFCNKKKIDLCLSNKYKYNKNEKFCFLSKWEKKGIEVPSEEDNIDQYANDILLIYKSLYVLQLIKKEIINYKKNKNKLLLRKIMYLTNIKNKIFKKLHRYV